MSKKNIRWRHFSVAVGIIPASVVYVLLCIALADVITGIHPVLDGLFYLVAGIAWIYPASFVVGWLARHEAE